MCSVTRIEEDEGRAWQRTRLQTGENCHRSSPQHPSCHTGWRCRQRLPLCTAVISLLSTLWYCNQYLLPWFGLHFPIHDGLPSVPACSMFIYCIFSSCILWGYGLRSLQHKVICLYTQPLPFIANKTARYGLVVDREGCNASLKRVCGSSRC